MLIVEHDMDFVMSLVDRVVVMEFGEKIAEGLPEEIQKNPAVLEAHLGGAEMARNVLEVKNLSVAFRQVEAVSNVSLSVGEGASSR